MMAPTRNPQSHRQPTPFQAGVSPEESTGVLVLLHGRGGSAQDALSLGEALKLTGVSLFAPQAEGNTWYPNSFLAPIANNEPWLSSSLDTVARVVDRCVALGVAHERIAIAGFSQGACLACEFVARNPDRYAGLAAFTGGLIGPPGIDLHHEGRLDGTPILLSSGDPDPHVPWTRVEETAKQFTAMGAAVILKRYPNRPHTIVSEELSQARALLMPSLTMS